MKDALPFQGLGVNTCAAMQHLPQSAVALLSTSGAEQEQERAEENKGWSTPNNQSSLTT